MKKIILIASLAAALLSCRDKLPEREQLIDRILLQTYTMETGELTTSIVYTAGKDTFALDFIPIDTTGHVCKWELCPYKGVVRFDWHEAITEYTGCEVGTDCYCIDWLHFEYPTYEYDQLDSLLFTPKY